jgi:hypothetical protein
MTSSGEDSNDDPESLFMRLVLKFGAAVGLTSVLFCSGLFFVGERMMEHSRRFREPYDLFEQVPVLVAISLLGGLVMFVAYSPWSDQQEPDG